MSVIVAQALWMIAGVVLSAGFGVFVYWALAREKKPPRGLSGCWCGNPSEVLDGYRPTTVETPEGHLYQGAEWPGSGHVVRRFVYQDGTLGPWERAPNRKPDRRKN